MTLDHLTNKRFVFSVVLRCQDYEFAGMGIERRARVGCFSDSQRLYRNEQRSTAAYLRLGWHGLAKSEVLAGIIHRDGSLQSYDLVVITNLC